MDTQFLRDFISQMEVRKFEKVLIRICGKISNWDLLPLIKYFYVAISKTVYNNDYFHNYVE